MTDQAYDVLLYRDRTYLIAGIAGYNYFTPAAHGLAVCDGLTSNWRGWVSQFSISDKTLRLSHAVLTLDGDKYDRHEPPQLFGVRADTAYSFTHVMYRFDTAPPLIPFTGGMLIDELFPDWQPLVYVGNVTLECNRNVRELIFEDGVLKRV